MCRLADQVDDRFPRLIAATSVEAPLGFDLPGQATRDWLLLIKSFQAGGRVRLALENWPLPEDHGEAVWIEPGGTKMLSESLRNRVHP